MTTTEKPKYAGDDRPEILWREKMLVIGPSAITATGSAKLPNELSARLRTALNQGVGIEDPVVLDFTGEQTKELVSALIEAEDHLHDNHDGSPEHLAIQRAIRATGRYLVDRGDKRGWLTHDIWLIVYNDTDYWTMAAVHPQAKESIERCESVHFFDRNRHVHLCEFTPSYELYWLENRCVFKDSFGGSDRLRDEISEAVWGAPNNQPVGYDHVQDIEKIIAANKPGTVYHYGNPGYDLDEVLEEVRDRIYRDRRHKDATVTYDQVVAEFTDWEERIYNQIMEYVSEALHENSVI